MGGQSAKAAWQLRQNMPTMVSRVGTPTDTTITICEPYVSHAMLMCIGQHPPDEHPQTLFR